MILMVWGRPGLRLLLKSNLWAISRRCQRSSVSGVTIVPSSIRTLRGMPKAFNPVLSFQILDDN
jgi:hypothetical protein